MSGSLIERGGAVLKHRLYRGQAWRALVMALLVACAALGIWAWSMYRTGSDWPTVEGQIVEIRESGNSGKTYNTTIRYAVEGIEYEFKSEYGDNRTRVGDPVTVSYEPGRPQRALTDQDRFIRGLVVGLGALTCLGVAALVGYGGRVARRVKDQLDPLHQDGHG